MIKQFIQGEETDRELFGLVGPWAVSEEVHKFLGVPVTGRTGDIWHVCFDGEKPVGFSQMRVLKDGECHIRYLYAETEKRLAEIVKATIAHARTLSAPAIFTNDRETATVWEKLGFKPQLKKRGTFCRWERELK